MIRRFSTLPLYTVKVPFIGDSIANVDVIKFYKNEGDNVVIDEVVCEIEGDKGTQPVNTPYSGVLTKVYAKIDDRLLIGEPLFDLLIDRYRPKLLH